MPATPEKRDFRDVQYAFARHLRDPENAPAPADVEDRRMAIYRDLFYRNVESFIAGSFPVLRKITPDEHWHAMVRDYFKRHQAHTPLFPKMPQEFLQYLQEERNVEDDPPFLLELAHYEWTELALALDTREIDWDVVEPEGDLLAGVPVLSPLVWPLSYRFPVHKIDAGFQPQQPTAQPTYLVVYRNRHDKVGFMELNPVAARLLELLQDNHDKTGRELLEMIAAELKHPDPEVVINGGLDIMHNLRDRDVLIGIKKNPAAI